MNSARIHVYKRKGGNYYRYAIGSRQLNNRDMEWFDALWFDFSPMLSVDDRVRICEKWKHKELLPEHREVYINRRKK